MVNPSRDRDFIIRMRENKKPMIVRVYRKTVQDWFSSNIKEMRILIVKLSAIGDCLLASPVASALRNSFPDAHIGWVVHEHCSGVIRENPNLNRVHTLPRKKLYANLPRLRTELRAEKYDIVIDLQGLFKSGLVSLLSGAKQRYGPKEAREGANLFYNHLVKRGLGEEHVVPGYLRFATELGAKWEDEPQMLMPFGQKELDKVNQLVSFSSADSYVVINPSAGKVIKQWSPEQFAQVGIALAKSRGAKLLITGAPADRHLADQILATIGGQASVTDLTGKTNLNELAALLSKVDLFIGGDTGPMHIAQAAGTRVLAIFGPTDPKTLGPRHPKHRIVTLNLECAPCRHRECPIGHLCLKNLEVNQVVRVAEEMLDEAKASVYAH
jgi:lipopolysaccharide heptosyltransferase I